MNIAKTEFLMLGPRGDRRRISVTIGKPYRTKGHAACPVGIRGLYDKVHDIHGDDTWQALLLAIQFVRITLGLWKKKGFRFASPDGHTFNPDKVWFQALTRIARKNKGIPNQRLQPTRLPRRQARG